MALNELKSSKEPKKITYKLAILTKVSIFIYANLLNTDNLIIICM